MANTFFSLKNVFTGSTLVVNVL